MMLSPGILTKIDRKIAEVPRPEIFGLPEKVLQFGTGVLLRGLTDYFIDKANKQGIYNGRIVVVKSTRLGDVKDFNDQEGLYTIYVKGQENGIAKEEIIINASISRVLSAEEEWPAILECAKNAQMQVIISNTTEVGIQLVPDNIHLTPPISFPGKLLGFLYKRFQVFGATENSGMVIIPTELIPDNGDKLRAIVIELAEINGLQENFMAWLKNSNYFCNSLVDRIVPGKPDTIVQTALEKKLGYSDRLLIMTEFYRLWAIEGDERVKKILTFSSADKGIVIESNIDKYRELKLRLLNGTHTLSCGVAFLSGFDTVRDAMADHQMHAFISKIMNQEIAPSIPYDIEHAAAHEFSALVLDRFANVEIKHSWLNITLQYSTKMKLRCMPVLLKHYQDHQTVPQLFAFGFAAYLFFMKGVTKRANEYYGALRGKEYLIQDNLAEQYYERWRSGDITSVVNLTVGDSFWGQPVAELPGFKDAVAHHLAQMAESGVKNYLKRFIQGMI